MAYAEHLDLEKANPRLLREHEIRYEFAYPFIQGSTVLDMGCGAGFGSDLLARSGADFVVAIDVSKQAIREAHSRYKQGNLQFIVMDASKLAFRERAVNTAVCFEVIEHVERPTVLLQEVKQALKPRGIFIMSTPNGLVYDKCYRYEGSRNPYHGHELAPTELQEILKKSFEYVALWGQRDSYLEESLARPESPLVHRQLSDPDFVDFRLSQEDIEHAYTIVALCADDSSAAFNSTSFDNLRSLFQTLSNEKRSFEGSGSRIKGLEHSLDELARSLAERDQQVASLKFELNLVEHSLQAVYDELRLTRDRLVTEKIKRGLGALVHRILPDGTARGELKLIFLLSLKVAKEEGVRNLIRQSLEKIRRREFRIVSFPLERVAQPATVQVTTPQPTGVVSRQTRLDRLKISWLGPEPGGPGQGGFGNIVRMCRYLAQFNHDVTLYVDEGEKYSSEEQIVRLVTDHYGGKPNFSIVRGYGRVTDCDALIATAWITAYSLNQISRCKKKFYFVQDYEPYFFPQGSLYFKAENTYKMGYFHITSGPWCTKLLREKYGAKCDSFRFPLDRKIYYPHRRTTNEKQVIFFARPEMTRRCFELGVEALQILYKMMPEVKVILFGSREKIDLRYLRIPCVNLGILPTVEDLARLYSNSEAALALSPTNPSLVTFEMMACGCPTVDLDLPPNRESYGPGENSVLVESTPEAIAQGLYRLLSDPEYRNKIRENALQFVSSFPDEEGSAREVEAILKRELASMTNIPDSERAFKTGDRPRDNAARSTFHSDVMPSPTPSMKDAEVTWASHRLELTNKLGHTRAALIRSVMALSKAASSVAFAVSPPPKTCKRILFYVSHNPDKHGFSSLFRAKAYFPYLKEKGFYCKIAQAIPKTDFDKVVGVAFLRKHSKKLFELWRGILIRSLIIKRAWDIGKAPNYDAVYLLRELIPDLVREPWMETLLRDVNPNLAFDFDDALYAPPSWYPVDETWRGERTKTLLRQAKQVIVGNETLKKYAEAVNPNVTVIPTCVDLPAYPVKNAGNKNSEVVLGWLGSWPNLFYLKKIEPALRELARSRKYQLRIVCDKPQDPTFLEFRGIHVDFRKWDSHTALREVSRFDVGLMPLTNDPWAAGKCGFKIIQYMACGVPVVASGVGVNRQLVTPKVNGYIADSMEEWVKNLSILIDRPELRISMGRKARAFVEANYDIRQYVDEFSEAIRRTYA